METFQGVLIYKSDWDYETVSIGGDDMISVLSFYEGRRIRVIIEDLSEKEEHMKKLVSVVEVEGQGYESLLGKEITVFGVNYIYTGTLAGVNDRNLLLENAAIVYETGPFASKGWKDAQQLPHPIYIEYSAIESVMAGVK